MVKSFEAEYKTYLAKVDSGELSQIDMQQKEAKLAQDQQAIQAYEVEVQNNIAAKKQELYQPILARVQSVVDAYGKEQGYSMIFDASIGGILFADLADDLMPVLKTKLGIQQNLKVPPDLGYLIDITQEQWPVYYSYFFFILISNDF